MPLHCPKPTPPLRSREAPQPGTGNEQGKKVVEHEPRGLRLHLFVQPRSHEPACYLGVVTVKEAEGDGPMRVVLELAKGVPPEVMRELGGEGQ